MVAIEPTPRRRTLDRLLHTFRRRRGAALAPDLGPGDRERVQRLVEALLAERETTAQRAMAEQLVELASGLAGDGRARLLELLAGEFGTDSAAVDDAVARVRAADPDARVPAERALRRSVIPRYADLFHVITGLPRGVQFLVDLRADVVVHPERDAGLGLLHDELTGHLATLFDVGLLELRQITWDSPASVLERLIETEAVHAIRGWDDLRHRLGGDQRCYAFFHPALPNEPIVFVEVALTRGLADNLTLLLEREAAVEDPDTAIFYSITSAQPGLAGVHLGNELIKHVVDQLRRDDDELKTFATLSPLPGFRAWLAEQVAAGSLTSAEQELLGDRARAVVGLMDRSWLDGGRGDQNVRAAVLSAAARYLTEAAGGRALDPVAHFHLSNGASVERVNWLANAETYGLDESLGVMVNYLYDRGRIAANAGAYVTKGEIRASSHVRNLVKTKP